MVVGMTKKDHGKIKDDIKSELKQVKAEQKLKEKEKAKEEQAEKQQSRGGGPGAPASPSGRVPGSFFGLHFNSGGCGSAALTFVQSVFSWLEAPNTGPAPGSPSLCNYHVYLSCSITLLYSLLNRCASMSATAAKQ